MVANVEETTPTRQVNALGHVSFLPPALSPPDLTLNHDTVLRHQPPLLTHPQDLEASL